MKTLLTSASLAALLTAAPLALAAPDSDQERLGYSLGVTLGKSIQQDVSDLDIDSFTQAIRDVYAGDELAMTDQEMADTLAKFQQQAQEKRAAEAEKRAEANKAEGEAYLEENAEKDGVTVTDSGLQYRELESGDGATPSAEDTVKVNYEGKLIDGTVFDSSYERGEPVSFRVGQVIDGWQEALQLMSVGDTWEIAIPSDLAYGAQGQGPIGPNETLIFKVELLDVTPAEAAESASDEQSADTEGDDASAE
ncbi:FKBP-type peptidyl-prolyl cis-trans isomerase [Halomonas elongata]|uniref:Peptidyl-prolyl cis-trans isomerase n=1 Tax=Halomonas elongata (strain ATCC 33173 / DSM 2581 / NBRC 15536 / NCIMB 2198 / 1H9) TaxID=768066 RepID=E1VBK5_HALED|nr:FKBP-type peptidyl-prolyl cis-trans isomerase [Halomonas elongata]WBF17928.1 FKBP-type peptidyl-prolyl cis-trans isomerase [Halomonas elongata]WPU46775.1 FKBP-type peptidyl-prolyl cis-trans isomerase [Halomonas elongata DSM 2581]CBV44162.2 FKBP-type peptidyl-prolyl cis-trans isomerase [Halomonas elongata DSM 2581]